MTAEDPKTPLRVVKTQPMTEKERQDWAIAYFSRHGAKDGAVSTFPVSEGLKIVRNKEGLWLDFSTADGLTASIHMDMIGPQGHPESIIQQTIDTWCKEFIKRNFIHEQL